jgi:hypothetical protein
LNGESFQKVTFAAINDWPFGSRLTNASFGQIIDAWESIEMSLVNQVKNDDQSFEALPIGNGLIVSSYQRSK